LKYDSVYGRYDKSVAAENGVLAVAGSWGATHRHGDRPTDAGARRRPRL